VDSERRAKRVYREDEVRALAMPLGGIGTGSIALCGDGSLRQWQIHNQVNHQACVPHSFFAVWAKRDHWHTPPVARVLQSPALYDAAGPEAPWTSNDHQVPIAHQSLLARLPGVQGTEFVGEYPIAEVSYLDSELPVSVRMEAFNPFVPLNARDSAIPAILFQVTVRNPGAHRMNVSLAATLQNSVGWDGVEPIVGAHCPLYGGNENVPVQVGEFSGLLLRNSRLEADAPGNGTMVLAARAREAMSVAQWGNLDSLWADFSADGRLHSTVDGGPSPAGVTWNGALAVPFSLEPGQSRSVTFLIGWHFPNRVVNYNQKLVFGFADEKSRFWLGNRYHEWYRSALDVLDYVDRNLDRLESETRLARETFHDTTLPEGLIGAVTSQMSIVRTPSCFWVADGHFYGFEGCCGVSTLDSGLVGGCCPLNCTHVWNYEMAMARLYPELDRSMRDTEWGVQQRPDGHLPDRVLLPTYLPREGFQGGWVHQVRPAIDGLLGGVVKTYREYRACGDHAWLAAAWPGVKKALEHVWCDHDPERRGIIEGEQFNTYDIAIFGVNTFIGTLYLAALRAAERMALLFEEASLAEEYKRVFCSGSAELEKRLWNGEYYVQQVDLTAHPEQNWAKGCHADQLLGQWWAHVLDLGWLLDPEHEREAARAIVRHNMRDSFAGIRQAPRQYVTDEDQGLLNCTWPRGGQPPVPTLYSHEVWSGIEYEVAGLLLQQGDVEPAMRVLDAVWKRYDGRKLNPWNNVECGDHYVRAMSSWALLEAASGFSYDASRDEIAFGPVLTPDHYRAPWVARDGWGMFTQEVGGGRQTATITVTYGALTVRTWRLRARVPVREVTLRAGDRAIPVTWRVDEETIVLDLNEALTVCAPCSIVLSVSGPDFR
jgi:non-lysosomal glucosylceramidase